MQQIATIAAIATIVAIATIATNADFIAQRHFDNIRSPVYIQL